MAKGHVKERHCAGVLRAHGFMVASRRHEPGPGDLLAARTAERPLLVEVKATAGGPYERFNPVDQQAMSVARAQHGVEVVLAWYPVGLIGAPIWIPEIDWPIWR